MLEWISFKKGDEKKMLNILLSSAASKTGGGWWIYVVLIVLVVVMLVVPSLTNRKKMKEYNQMLDQLRVGDEVRTIGGIIGKVTKVNTKGEIKTFTLETGSKGSKTTMEFDMAAVGTVLKSTYVAPIKDEKPVEKVEKTEETKESAEVKVEEPAKEEVAESTTENAVTEAAKPEKKTTKKSKK